jgi:hypothetical protein
MFGRSAAARVLSPSTPACRTRLHGQSDGRRQPANASQANGSPIHSSPEPDETGYQACILARSVPSDHRSARTTARAVIIAITPPPSRPSVAGKTSLALSGPLPGRPGPLPRLLLRGRIRIRERADVPPSSSTRCAGDRQLLRRATCSNAFHTSPSEPHSWRSRSARPATSHPIAVDGEFGAHTEGKVLKFQCC